LSSSEQQSSEEDMLDMETRKTITKTIYNTLCQGDSQVQSPMIASSPDTEENSDKEKGAREKRFSDGRVEVWYSNGNRCSLCDSDGDIITYLILQEGGECRWKLCEAVLLQW
jgi:hypothetical protein